MDPMLLLALTFIPGAVGILLLVIPGRTRLLHEFLTVLTTMAMAGITIRLWGRPVALTIPWSGFGIDFQLRYDRFSQLIAAAIAGFSLLIAVYSWKFLARQQRKNQFYGLMLISETLALGSVIANNLVLMLVFWEALMITLYGMIAIGNERAWRTGMKTFIIVGFSDLCLMLGVGMAGVQAKTLVMTEIHLTTLGLGGAAYVLLMIGAMAKAGAVPFHTWIPDAAIDAPLPFMAFLPASIEKLIGIYLATRITLDFFTINSALEIFMMGMGAVTIVIASSMVLLQTEYKRLLSYSAVSQVGYILLGIGSGTPIGVVGGLFHMLNHAIYKTCLFLTAGAVEKEAGTTEFRNLGGLAKSMPVTFVCFLIAAAAMAGFPGLNAFVSKELIFESLVEHDQTLFLVVAVLGVFLNTIAFVKLGHAVFFGKSSSKQVAEVHWTMALPMLILAALCIVFGLNHRLPVEHLIKPALSGRFGPELAEAGFGFALSGLFWVTVGTLVVAALSHWLGVKLSGCGAGATDYIRNFPILKTVYDLAQKRVFDPYDFCRPVLKEIVYGLFVFERSVDWIFQRLIPWAAQRLSSLRAVHTGLYADYLAWSIAGMVGIVIYITWVMK